MKKPDLGVLAAYSEIGADLPIAASLYLPDEADPRAPVVSAPLEGRATAITTTCASRETTPTASWVISLIAA
jgi:hypothetical protein